MNFEPSRWGLAAERGALPEAAWRWLADRLGMPALLATPPRAMRDIALPPSRLPDAAREKFVALLGADQVRSDAAIRIQHGGGGILGDRRRRAVDLAHAPDAVLLPRTESEVVAVVRACAELNVTLGGGDERPCVALDLAHLTRLDFDTMSGLVTAEAGIASAELARRLAARGLAADMPGFDALGGVIAANRDTGWLQRVRVATPLGLASELRDLAAGSGGAFGMITAAALRVRPLPFAPQVRRYIFPDFAAGLAALHQAAKANIAHSDAHLSDAAASNFAHGLARAGHPFDLLARLRDIHLEMRHFDDRAGTLALTFPDAKARKAFEALVKRLGGMRLHGEMPAPDLRPLAERGVNAERFTVAASWARLPVLYATARHALDQAMRSNVPRPGAHGLVLADVSGTRPDGATLTLTAIYPRKLDDAMAQAESVHKAGMTALASPLDAPSQAARAAIKQALDPKNILPPLQA
jgi:alkyldihydroxyacetonephosphate synthase